MDMYEASRILSESQIVNSGFEKSEKYRMIRIRTVLFI
jgi:hypothetical protein